MNLVLVKEGFSPAVTTLHYSLSQARKQKSVFVLTSDEKQSKFKFFLCALAVATDNY